MSELNKKKIHLFAVVKKKKSSSSSSSDSDDEPKKSMPVTKPVTAKSPAGLYLVIGWI